VAGGPVVEWLCTARLVAPTHPTAKGPAEMLHRASRACIARLQGLAGIGMAHCQLLRVHPGVQHLCSEWSG
jgi:hypothetical protein